MPKSQKAKLSPTKPAADLANPAAAHRQPDLIRQRDIEALFEIERLYEEAALNLRRRLADGAKVEPGKWDLLDDGSDIEEYAADTTDTALSIAGLSIGEAGDIAEHKKLEHRAESTAAPGETATEATAATGETEVGQDPLRAESTSPADEKLLCRRLHAFILKVITDASADQLQEIARFADISENGYGICSTPAEDFTCELVRKHYSWGGITPDDVAYYLEPDNPDGFRLNFEELVKTSRRFREFYPNTEEALHA